jgi:hypothetical protein
LNVSVRSLIRSAFWGYAALLFVLTHWPSLKVPGAGRKDLVLHLAIFAIWTALLIACGYFGAALSRRNLAIVLAIAPVYAAIDESLQAIPWIRRHAAWDDYAMNISGVVAAVAAAAVLAALRRNQSRARATIGSTPMPGGRDTASS